MTRALPLTALALASLLAFAPAAMAQNCAGALDVKGSALTGTWTVVKGEATTGGNPMIGGSDTLSMQTTGNGLTLQIEGYRIPLTRVDPATVPWVWERSADAVVDSNEFAVVLGCENDALGRYEGTQRVAGQTVTWRVMVESATSAYVLWTFPGPPPSVGLFALTK
jgi:hypothetical protein